MRIAALALVGKLNGSEVKLREAAIVRCIGGAEAERAAALALIRRSFTPLAL